MNLKDKFAAFLRRWASKLSPETNYPTPDYGLYLPSLNGLATYEVRRIGTVYAISPDEEMASSPSTTTGLLPRRGKAFA